MTVLGGVVVLAVWALLIVVVFQVRAANPDRRRFDAEGRDRLGPGFSLETRPPRDRRGTRR